MVSHLRIPVALLLCTLAATARAADARFDLIGPKIEVHVTRAGLTLPVASVPNLQPGDRIWLHPDLPPTQSVHYLMVVVFLRGTTNPPPDSWFTRIETWDKKVRAEGVEVTVPDEAEQSVLFLAPATGGDFGTLRSAVQGRPGVFVRASQDLTLAGFEQGRIERYLVAMRQLTPEQTADSKVLLEHSNRIAATLALKPNPDCAKLAPDLQYTCLTQSGTQTLLDDGHGQTIAAALSTGPNSDFINQASYTRLAGSGAYSAYVGAIVDLVRIMGTLHTAQYQYIPAISFPQQEALNLRLNVPPSFHNPKSVIVIGLPAIQATSPPPLRPADPNLVACLAKPRLVLPVEGAPLVFSTGFAHDLVLHLNYPAGTPADAAAPQDIPLRADAYRGGLVVTPEPKRHELPPGSLPAKVSLGTVPAGPAPAAISPAATNAAEVTGTITGFWGFNPFTGPAMPLQRTPGKDWKLAGSDPIIAGKDKQVVIASTGTACIQSIALDAGPTGKTTAGKQPNLVWKPADKPQTVAVSLNLPSSIAGTLHLDIQQFGEARTESVSLTAYSEPARLAGLVYHSGDQAAVLTGMSLDQVRGVELGKLSFKPDHSAISSSDRLSLTLPSNASAKPIPSGDKLTAKVALNDGRTLTLPVTVATARPSVTLLSKASLPSPVKPDSASPAAALPIQLANPDDLPIDQQLTFSLKSAQPFQRAAQIEIASADDSLHAILSVASGSLVLQDPKTVVATLDPLKVFGSSAFGPLRLRAVAPDGTPGDWLPLTTLVRLPTLTALTCPAPPPSPKPTRPSRRGSQTAAAAIPVDAAAPNADPIAKTDLAPSAGAIAPEPPPCTLTGSNLYLVDALAATSAFTNPTAVPGGFVGTSLSVPAPSGPNYYLRLRDDPTAADSITLPSTPQ